MYRYILFNGAENFREMLKFLASTLFSMDVPYSPPKETAWEGVYGTETYESVDGATLYYERDHELWSQPVGGGAAVRLLPYMRHGWWSVLGEGIVWVDLRNGEGKEEEPKPVMLFDPRTRRLSKIGVINGILHSDRPDFCVSPDFRLILYVRGEFNNSGIRMLFNPR